MMSLVPFLVAGYLDAAVARPVSPLVRKLTCVERMDHAGHPHSTPFLTRTRATSLGLRFEYLRVYPEGQVVFVVSIHDSGTIDCQATLASERLQSFRSELLATKFWTLRPGKSPGGREVERLAVALDQTRRGDFEMTPGQWNRSPVTRAVQAAIDRLKMDICGGPCPEPKER